MALTVEPSTIDAADIDDAVARGILTAEQREAIIALARGRRAAVAAPDDEQFRLLTSFNDILVTLAILVLLFGAGAIFAALMPKGKDALAGILAGAAVAVIAWGLAGYFMLKRRMALPSIVLLMAFVGGLAAAGASTGTAMVPRADWTGIGKWEWTTQHQCEGFNPEYSDQIRQHYSPRRNGALRTDPMPGRWEPSVPQFVARPGSVCARYEAEDASSIALSSVLAGFVGVLAALLYWRRFRVPITIAAGCAAGVGLLFGLARALTPGSDGLWLTLAGVAGLGVFALAMRYDVSDPRRETRRTDIAFWLHLLAAPLIVHPLMTGLGVFDGTPSPLTAAVVIGLYLVFAAVALVIDRRALLVSALAYVLYAISTLLRSGGAADLQVPLTALVIGLFLVSLSALWRQARARAVALLPEPLALRLPTTAH